MFHICNIISKDQRDLEVLSEVFDKYPVNISDEFIQEEYYGLPTLVLGWNFIKEKFPNQNIFNHTLDKNLTWAFSRSENDKIFLKQVEDFFTASISQWLPKEFILYDSYLNKESIETFCENNFNSQKNVFVHFSNGALYVFNDNKSYVLNIKSLAHIDKQFRSTLSNLFNKYNIVCFSYYSICEYVDLDMLNDITALDSLMWVKYGTEIKQDYFQIVPGIKMDKYIPFMLNKHASVSLDFEEQRFYKRMCERDKITCWLSSREVAFELSLDKPLDFKLRRNHKLAKIHYSNKRTLTSRITAQDEYNPQNLERNNDDRKQIISRFDGGNIVVFDYVSFESKIAMYLSEDSAYIEEYYNEDLHAEAATIMFERPDVTSEERKFSKNINHAIIFGGGEELLIDKLAEKFHNPHEQLQKVKLFLRPIIKKANEIRETCKVNGYMINPWGSIIRVNKVFASFNNYCQTYASEIVVDKMVAIKQLLKPYRSQFLFQVHDSMVFDIHPSETDLIEKIVELLKLHKGMLFNVDYSIGKNYKDVS